MPSYPRPSRRPHLEIVAIDGHPTDTEWEAVRTALELVVEHERSSRGASVWLRAGRAQGRRLGMYDYRDRFAAADAWRLSLRFPPGGREYPGLLGRGDAR